MTTTTTIANITAREILDSRGNPTVRAEVSLAGGAFAEASVPSGASTGSHEAAELRDGNAGRYRGLGVQRAVSHVREKIAPLLAGMDAADQYGIDAALRQADGTANKERLGANAVLAVSLATARAAAAAFRLPLFRYIGGINACILPIPMMNIVNGGAHSSAPIDFQELMIVPRGARSFREALRCGSEIFHELGSRLKERGLSTAVGDEGGFAPMFGSIEDALDCILYAVRHAGYDAGEDVALAIDAAANEFYSPSEERYNLTRCGRMGMTAADLTGYYCELVAHYPIISIEDGCAENDREGWKLLTATLGKRCQLVGDDLFVTNREYLLQGISSKVANAILIKPNQIGTVSETMSTMNTAGEFGYNTIVSHRSGETGDTFIADLAVGMNAGQIKAGSLSRSERLEKYNRLLTIEDELGAHACYGTVN